MRKQLRSPLLFPINRRLGPSFSTFISFVSLCLRKSRAAPGTLRKRWRSGDRAGEAQRRRHCAAAEPPPPINHPPGSPFFGFCPFLVLIPPFSRSYSIELGILKGRGGKTAGGRPIWPLLPPPIAADLVAVGRRFGGRRPTFWLRVL